jgi:hypothetical protein
MGKELAKEPALAILFLRQASLRGGDVPRQSHPLAQ